MNKKQANAIIEQVNEIKQKNSNMDITDSDFFCQVNAIQKTMVIMYNTTDNKKEKKNINSVIDHIQKNIF